MPKHSEHISNGLINVHLFQFVQVTFASKFPEVTDYVGGPLHLGSDFAGDFAGHIRIKALTTLYHFFQKITADTNSIQGLVQLVCYPCRHLSQGSHLARLDQLGLCLDAIGNVSDIGNNDIFPEMLPGAGMDVHVDYASIFFAMSHLGQKDTRLHHRGSDLLCVFWITQIAERHLEQLFSGVTVLFSGADIGVDNLEGGAIKNKDGIGIIVEKRTVFFL